MGYLSLRQYVLEIDELYCMALPCLPFPCIVAVATHWLTRPVYRSLQASCWVESCRGYIDCSDCSDWRVDVKKSNYLTLAPSTLVLLVQRELKSPVVPSRCAVELC